MLRIKKYLSGKKAVIWDWNGTLLNDVEMVVDAISHVLKDHGLQPPTVKEYTEIFGFPVSDYYRRLGIDYEKVSFEEVSQKFVSQYMNAILGCQLHHGVKEVLQFLHESGVSQSILSAGHEDSLKHHLHHFGIAPFFEHVYGLSDHHARGKVERGKELLSAAGYAQQSTLLIGDTDHDLEVGKQLGIDVLLLADGHQSFERLSKLHDWVIEDRHALEDEGV
jgi:phosphoglycolate phosphatase